MKALVVHSVVFLLGAVMLVAADPEKPKEEVIDLPKMQVKGIPTTTYGIGVAGTRDRVTRKVKRLFVSEIIVPSEAARLGLKEQDEIVAINGIQVTEMDGLLQPGSQLFDLLVNQPTGQQITLDVLSRQPATITLTARTYGSVVMAPKHSHPAHFISVAIARAPAEVYAFAANPENLPKWAAGLSGSIKQDGGDWVADSPMGKVKVRFAEKNTLGVLDHEVTLPSGDKVYNPLRVQPNGTGSEVVFTLYRLPGVLPEDFQKDAGRVRQDLDRLKALLEK